MRILTCFATATFLLASIAPAVAAADEPPATTAKSAKASDPRLDPNTIVCKSVETTGTRLGAKKVCHSRGEWANLAAETRLATDRMQSSANGATH